MGLRAMAGSIIIEFDEADKHSEGGITLLNDQNAGKPRYGTVKYISDNSTYKPGDRVLMPPHGGAPIKYEFNTYYAFTETEIWATVGDEDEPSVS